jgi:NADH-quinone oxidoreductase subunit E
VKRVNCGVCTVPWIAENRRLTQVSSGEPLLTEEIKTYLRDKYFPRYPTKRAVLLPALHHLQHEYGWLPAQAILEVAEFLEIAPAEALDTASFYEEYWLKPKGKYLIQVCRSLSCEICDSEELTQQCREILGIDIGETTSDGRFTLVELECLGSCGTAPAALVNDVLHEELTPAKLQAIIDKLPDDPHDYSDPLVPWERDNPQDALEHFSEKNPPAGVDAKATEESD